jgi:hypothetical protein
MSPCGESNAFRKYIEAAASSSETATTMMQVTVDFRLSPGEGLCRNPAVPDELRQSRRLCYQHPEASDEVGSDRP